MLSLRVAATDAPLRLTRPMNELFTWRKLSAAKWDDVWPERLAEFADRLAITTIVGGKTSRLEIFALSRREADRIAKEFGGVVSKQTRDWMASPATPRAAINVRGKLRIVATEAELKALGGSGGALTAGADGAGLNVQRSTSNVQRSKQRVLWVPAGMAFGTGEHATTLNCLRFIADLAEGRDDAWEFLDLGCGSGILALAARALGASKVEAGDFDPACVRIAKENVRLNKLRGVAVNRMDVLEWKPDRTWPVIAANLYSTILIQIAPKLARALAPGGTLVFSGVMRQQESEVRDVFAKAGLCIGEVKRQGKWVAGLATGRKKR
jgi:ribosomal protein L11 methyltransferase